jgi:DNA invertase Pin-like site-specific DNA recombinase
LNVARSERLRAQAVELYKQRRPLIEIAATLGVSDTTVRKYLRDGLAREGLTMPDLRRKDAKTGSPIA